MVPKILWSAVFLVFIVLLVWSTPAKRIEKDRLSEIVRQLASEAFQGRAPGTVGEAKTLAYLTAYFTSLGLSPGGQQGSWTQTVPLIHTQLQAPFDVVINSENASWQLQQATDLLINYRHQVLTQLCIFLN